MIKSKLRIVPWLMFSLLMLPELAQAKKLGVGAVIGAPTGLSVNYFLRQDVTVHTTLAYDFGDDDDLQLASHYTWRRNTLSIEKVRFGWFYGLGARLAFNDHDHNHRHHDHDDHFHLGPSGTLGLFHEFKEVPLELFLKGNLTANIIQDTGIDGDLMLGLHYNF
ncbi:hypothetical protein [Peredibacter starrii]|uniref:Outer membrane protein beta-barrel domain-containing protein n=1 Tax=Peredibacter starrii TaxID=28202 RepID=A0AAX4HN79_9BACT|nr:hypothetical protein [Peredibacter starrii]WPU64359.1 hypothetical protein SOO65_16820 [Peredibacter starrii]